MEKQSSEENEFNRYHHFADFYDRDFKGSYHDDVEFYLTLVKKYCDEVLELCCGTGRITIPLAQSKIRVTAIDISKEMLFVLRTKLEQKEIELSNRITLIEANMVNFSLNKKFKCILIPFHSFQSLTDNFQISQALETIFCHLEDTGVFILNIFRPIENMEEIEGLCEKKVITDEKGEIIYKKKCTNTFVDTFNQIIYYELQYSPFDKGSISKCLVEQLKAKYYYLSQMKEILEQHNFAIENLYHGFNTKKENDSTEITFVCKKRINIHV